MGSFETSAFRIPTIDIHPYLKDPESDQADDVVEQIRAACVESGFFQLIGHGVDQSLQQKVFAAAKKFFSLPDDEKRSLRGQPGRGYELIGTQFLEPGKAADLKEGFFIGREIPGLQPPYRNFEQPNIWPSPDSIPEVQFKEPLLEYHEAVMELALTIMRVLSSGMKDVDTSVFEEFCRQPVASMRLLHYPPHPDSDDERLVGTGAHTDFGAITLLLQDGQSGLQVLNHHTNEWIDVEPRQDSYIVNVGDMLDVWTGGLYRSTVHRVINTSGTDIYSIPFFFDGNLDCRIQCLDGRAKDGKGRSFTVEGHMLSRYKTYT